MDLDVNLDLSADIASLNASGKQSTDFERIEAGPANSVTPSSEASAFAKGRKRQASRQSSLTSVLSSSKRTAEPNDEENKSSATQKRRRKTRHSLQGVQEDAESSLFTKPTSSTRVRHLISRRYSPSPDTRPGAKLKNLITKLKVKEKSGRKRLEFSLIKLTNDYEASSSMILESLESGPIDFELRSVVGNTAVVLPAEEPSIVISPPVPNTQGVSTSTSVLNSPSTTCEESVMDEEMMSTKSSDDEEGDDADDEPAGPVVRMADIGAAPFTPAPVLPISTAATARPTRRFKPSAPVIKLPRRRTFDFGNKADSERSSLGSTCSADGVSKTKELPRQGTIVDRDSVDNSSAVPITAEKHVPTPMKSRRRRTVVTVIENVHTSMTQPMTLEPSSSMLKNTEVENTSEESTSQSSSVPGKRRQRVTKSKRGTGFGCHQKETSSKIKEIDESPATDRRRRLSAGKTIDFLTQVTKNKRPSVETKFIVKSSANDASTSNTKSDSPNTCSVVQDCPKISSGMSETEMKRDAAHSPVDGMKVQDDPLENSEQYFDKFRSDAETALTDLNNDKEDDANLYPSKYSASQVKITKSKPHSISLKTVDEKMCVSLAHAGSSSSSSMSRKSSGLLSIRRSSRNHTLTEKMRDSDLHPKNGGSSTPTTCKPVDPNSALGILQRVSRFTRPIRSPSPQPLQTILPLSQRRAVAPATEQEQLETSTAAESLTSKENVSSECESRSIEQVSKVDASGNGSANDKDNALDVVLGPHSSNNFSAVDEKEKICSPRLHKVEREEEEVETSSSTGRSSRVVRPSSRFVNADFVSPLRRTRGSKSGIAEFSTGKGRDSLVTSNTPGRVGSPQDEIKPGDAVDIIHQSVEQKVNADLPESSPAPAPPVTPVHTMETRRRSLGKKTRPIKIKLRLGSFPRVIAVNSGNETKTDEPKITKQAVLETPSVKKPTPKKYISPWSRYIPSVKPVLGNVYYSDGTVEKLGVSVNAVMDRLLAEVCQDGITRHSAIVNKREKKRRNIEKARERVARLKEEKAAREAQGWVVKQSKTSYPEIRELSPNSNDLGPRVRNRGNLLQKDFLYPSLKRGTKAEKKKNDELRRARSRRVMSQLAGSAYEEPGLPNTTRRRSVPSKDPEKVAVPREPSPFNPENQERFRLEAEERERQKRLTMPISFNTFLSSKTSVLTAQPLLQPQRVNDRAAVADHFYRELLCEYTSTGEPVEDSWNEFDMDVEDCLDVTTIEAVHIPKFDDYVAPPELDESAEPVAAEVEQMMLRPSLYAEEDGISYLYKRALEQPELRRNLLSMAIDCISALHVARLSASGREAAVIVYNTVTHQASKMRDVICMFNKEREEAVFWMHRYLIEMLPVELLASYLFLLRHTRLLVKSIVRSTQNECSPWPEVTRIIGKYVEVNVVEPDAADLDRTITPASLSDVIFVLVAPNISVGDFSVRDRSHDSIFKWLRDLGHPASSIVRIKIDETYSTAISELVYTAVNMISRVVTRMVREHRQKRVVLVGWGTTCCFNHMVLSSIPGVSAVIDLAFPVLSLDGPRGEPDDDILLTYCPSLFVVGSQACDYHPGVMKMMRSSMIMPSGLVVIDHANNNLLVSCATLSRLRITQRVISRCIVEQISDFLGMEWTKRERSRLVPLALNDTFKIDLTQLKIDEKAAQANRKPKDDGLIRKKKLSGVLMQSPIPGEASPSPLPVSQLESVRSNFQSLLKKAGTDKPIPWSDDRLLSNAFKEPRLPVKPISGMASPAPRTDSPNLLDPASISLI